MTTLSTPGARSAATSAATSSATPEAAHLATLASAQGPARSAAHGWLRRRGWEIVLWLALPALVFLLFPSYLVLASQVSAAALFALSLDLLVGYAGLLSLGHAAFFGLGAYTAGLLSTHGWTEPLSGLAAAGVLAGVLGFLTGFVVVRVRHLAQLMVTLGIGLLIFEGASRLRDVTGGDDGLQGMVIAPLFGLFPFDLYGHTAFAYAFGVLLACFIVLTRIIDSPFGLSLQGLRDNPQRMAAIGTPGNARLRKAYTIAAVFAGIAGGLLAQTTQFVALETLSFTLSAEVLIMLVLGGAGHRYGGLVGAAVFMIARDMLSDINPEYWQLGIGGVMVLVVLFAPGGVLGGWRGVREWAQSRGRAGAGDAALSGAAADAGDAAAAGKPSRAGRSHTATDPAAAPPGDAAPASTEVRP